MRWAELDLNQRRRSQRIYSPPPLTTRTPTHVVSRLLIVSQGLGNTKVFFEKLLKWAWRMGHWALGIGHWAWGMGNGTRGILKLFVVRASCSLLIYLARYLFIFHAINSSCSLLIPILLIVPHLIPNSQSQIPPTPLLKGGFA